MENKFKLHGYNKFTIVSNELIDNPNLTAKAKMLMIYIISKSNLDGWIFSTELIAQKMKDGIDAIKSGMRELEKNKYLFREQQREKNGTLSICVYHLFATVDEYETFMKERKKRERRI